MKSTGEDKIKVEKNQDSEEGAMTLKAEIYKGIWRGLPAKIILGQVRKVILPKVYVSKDTAFS